MSSMICGLCQHQQVVVALDVAGPSPEALAAIGSLVELVALDHRAHGAIEHDDALLEELAQRGDAAWRVLTLERSARRALFRGRVAARPAHGRWRR